MENTESRIELARLADGLYSAVVGRGLEGSVAEFLADRHPDRRAAVVVNSNIASLVVEGLLSLPDSGFTELVVFPTGGASKACEIKERVRGRLAARGFGRDTVIITLGGGVVTDLTGFVAATFTRGVSYVSLAMTLLGAADAATEGKTAVDTPATTNLIGVFHQPAAVFIDLDRWLMLSDRQIRGGLEEIVKHTCIVGTVFFEVLKDASVEWGLSPAEFVRDDALTELAARRNYEIKRDFATSDVYEGSRCMGLNLGHTIGRALETAAGYALNHGECVAIGLTLRFRPRERLGHCSPSDVVRIEALLKAIGLPTKIPEEIPVDRIMEAIAYNKKGKAGAIRLILQDGVGRLVMHDDRFYAWPIATEDAYASL